MTGNDDANFDVGGGLFSISLSDSEDGDGDQDQQQQQQQQQRTGPASNGGGGAARDRTGQTEAEFQAVKTSYRPKIENGEIWRHAAASAAEAQALNRRAPSVPKQEAQELLHAVEELYFYRRYDEAVAFVGRVLEGRDGDGDGVALLLDGDVRDVLRSYEAKCLVKMGRS